MNKLHNKQQGDDAPLVSVVIPTANRPELLRRAIRSVLDQTYQHFELIIVDDGQRESAQHIPEEFSDPRIIYHKNETSLGGGGTRNVGATLAKGVYVAFLDDDDEWVKEKLKKQIDLFKKTDLTVGFCYTSIRTKSELKEEVSQVLDGVNELHELSLTHYKGFLTSTLMVKKEVFDDVGGFDESLPSHQEAELIIRITKKYKGLGINEPLVVMDISGHEHIGGNMDRRIQGRELLLKKHADTYQAYPKKYARQYFQLALWYRSVHRYDEAKKILVKTILLDPMPRYIFHYIKLVLTSVMR